MSSSIMSTSFQAAKAALDGKLALLSRLGGQESARAWGARCWVARFMLGDLERGSHHALMD